MTTDREVLAELVALKDLKRRIDDHAAIGAGLAKHRVMVADYNCRAPLAWAAARARLALPEAVPVSAAPKFVAGYYPPSAQVHWKLPAVHGVCRDAENPNALVVIFRREPTDDELRSLHDLVDAHEKPLSLVALDGGPIA